MNLIAQTIATTAFSLRSLPRRICNSSVIVIGIAGVVAVSISVMAMSLGFRSTIRGDGREDRAIVLARGSLNEFDSSLARANLAEIMNATGIKRTDRGDPLISGEIVTVAPVARRRDGSDVNITLRGVGELYFALRPELKLIAGRPFRPGTRELVVGESARAQFVGLELGDHVQLQDGEWSVVGLFSGGDSARESEVVADAQSAMDAFKRDAYNSISVQLESANAFSRFRNALLSDPTLNVIVRSEPDYLATASGSINRLLDLVAYGIGSIMALGAVFGALNSMHAAVAARRMEMATLRAIGFSSLAVSSAVLIESLLLALLGALAGVAIAYAAFNGKTISTLGGAVWDSQLVYSLKITPSLALLSTLLACALGLLGGIYPAIRVAKENVAEALRET